MFRKFKWRYLAARHGSPPHIKGTTRWRALVFAVRISL
jgi:hypothetical protein